MDYGNSAGVTTRCKSAPAARYMQHVRVKGLNLVLLGKTGTGKSSVGNALLKANGTRKEGLFDVTEGMCATVMECAEERSFFMQGRRIRVVDTPGVLDNNKEENGGGDKKVLKEICFSVAKCPDGVDAFFIVLRLDSRFTKDESEAIDKLETLFRPDFWRYVVLIFTHTDCYENDTERCTEMLEKAIKDIRGLKRLTSKVKTPRIMIDTRKGADPKVASEQVTSILGVVDNMVVKNKARFKSTIIDPVLAVECVDLQFKMEEMREKTFLLERDKEEKEEMIKDLEEKMAMKDFKMAEELAELQRQQDALDEELWQLREEREGERDALEKRVMELEGKLAEKAEKAAEERCSIL